MIHQLVDQLLKILFRSYLIHINKVGPLLKKGYDAQMTYNTNTRVTLVQSKNALLCAKEKLQRFYMGQMILGSIDAVKMDAVAFAIWALLKLQPVPQPHMMDTECINMKKKALV